MTKNIIKIIFSLIVAVVVACTDNNSDATIGFFLGEYESKALELSAVGGKETILVETNERWIATTNVPWITISPANGIGTGLPNISIWLLLLLQWWYSACSGCWIL